MKDEALKLADDLENRIATQGYEFTKKASAMIRRLVEELDKPMQIMPDGSIQPVYTTPQTNTCKHDVDDGACKECYEEATQTKQTRVKFDNGSLESGWITIETPQTKPLSDKEITKLHLQCWNEIEFARAIEERHGIK